MNIAIILAAGSGTRMGGNTPKQFLEINGKKIMDYSIEAFEQNAGIDEIAIVTRPDFLEEVKEIVSRGGYRKVRKIIGGGKERYDSSLAAIKAYPNDDDCLLLHDCVRPLVSQRIINDCLEALKRHDAVDVGVKSIDTVVMVDEENRIVNIPDRATLRNGQTPQCFRRRVIAKAFENALKDPDFKATDDCGVVHRYLPEQPIVVVDGDVSNIKVTHREDLEMVKMIISSRQP